jgi:hypothetical protein
MKSARKIDWQRVARVGFIGLSIGFAFVACSPITGIMGHMIIAILDTAFASHLSPAAPYVSWALAGALIGAGPALWSFGPIRKRRMLVLWAPLAVVLLVGVISTLLIGHA